MASAGWFATIGIGAQMLVPIFASPSAWRWLDAMVGTLMFMLAGMLAWQVTDEVARFKVTYKLPYTWPFALKNISSQTVRAPTKSGRQFESTGRSQNHNSQTEDGTGQYYQHQMVRWHG